MRTIRESVPFPGATAHVQHIRDGKVIWEGETHNVVTDSGRDFLHVQGYATAGIGANGLNYIGLSADGLFGQTYTLTNTITTAGGRTAKRAIFVTFIERKTE